MSSRRLKEKETHKKFFTARCCTTLAFLQKAWLEFCFSLFTDHWCKKRGGGLTEHSKTVQHYIKRLLAGKSYLWQRCCVYCERRWRWLGKRILFPPPSVGGTWRRTSSSELPGSGPGTPRRHGLRLNSTRSPGAQEESMRFPPDFCKIKTTQRVIFKRNTMPGWKSLAKSTSTCEPRLLFLFAPACWGTLWCTASDTWDWIPSFAEHSPCSSGPTPGRVFPRCRRSASLPPPTGCTPL